MKSIQQMKEELMITPHHTITCSMEKLDRLHDTHFLFTNVFQAFVYEMTREVYGDKNYSKRYQLMNMYYPYFKRYINNNIMECELDRSRTVIYHECLDELSQATTMINRKNKIGQLKMKLKGMLLDVQELERMRKSGKLAIEHMTDLSLFYNQLAWAYDALNDEANTEKYSKLYHKSYDYIVYSDAYSMDEKNYFFKTQNKYNN